MGRISVYRGQAAVLDCSISIWQKFFYKVERIIRTQLNQKIKEM